MPWPGLAAIDAVLNAPGLPERWLPRAASLIPQLLQALRQTDATDAALQQRISRDLVLAAEVLRVAASPHYMGRGRVAGLGDALARIGHSGVQQAIARVLLRPMFDPSAQGSAPLQTLFQALQAHADWQAEAMAVAASMEGLGSFDGYLAGLLHGVGWQALVRIADHAGAWPSAPATPEIAEALARRAHRLFGRAAQAWDLTPAFSAFAEQAAAGDALTAPTPLTRVWAMSQPLSPLLGNP